MTANTMVVRNLVGVVSFIAVITAAGLALGRHDPPATAPDVTTAPPTAEDGERVFQAKGCIACHTTDGSARVGPSFAHRWGTRVALAGGDVVTFDAAYVRESLRSPQAQAQAGYPPAMPTFDGLLKEREIAALIVYLRTL